jgi:hypothetical protein
MSRVEASPKLKPLNIDKAKILYDVIGISRNGNGSLACQMTSLAPNRYLRLFRLSAELNTDLWVSVRHG